MAELVPKRDLVVLGGVFAELAQRDQRLCVDAALDSCRLGEALDGGGWGRGAMAGQAPVGGVRGEAVRYA
jgi:hypothetical protein